MSSKDRILIDQLVNVHRKERIHIKVQLLLTTNKLISRMKFIWNAEPCPKRASSLTSLLMAYS